MGGKALVPVGGQKGGKGSEQGSKGFGSGLQGRSKFRNLCVIFVANGSFATCVLFLLFWG